MNKTELITAVAEKTGMSKKDADSAVNAVLDTIIEAVACEEKVQIVGFGTFEVRARSERQGRDPRTIPRSRFRLPRCRRLRRARHLKMPWSNKFVPYSGIKGCKARGKSPWSVVPLFLLKHMALCDGAWEKGVFK